MNNRLKTSSRVNQLTLGDLIVAVSSSSRNSREAAAALADMFGSGQVSLSSRRNRRVRIC